jgi:hypothetical protein
MSINFRINNFTTLLLEEAELGQSDLFNDKFKQKETTYRGKFLVIGRTITALSRNTFEVNFCGRKSI